MRAGVGTRRAGVFLATALAASGASAATFPVGFHESTVLSNLSQPTVVKFASDGRIFVAEKSGLIKVFSGLDATSFTVFADLRSEVYDYLDRGLLGFELHPNFPATPYVYVLYTLDKDPSDPSSPIPTWGDDCPTPPGPTTDGCPAGARLSRLTAIGSLMVPGSELTLLGPRNDGTGESWCQQFPGHSIGTVAFGQDGALYVTSGEGASYDTNDYGQHGGTLPNSANPRIPRNVCGDPPGGKGGVMSPPTAQGGSLRSQSLRRPSGPVVLNGALLRLNPDTGAAMPDNPLAANPDDNARRIVAYGLRNPFRFTIRPGTSEVWIGDVGDDSWEEVDRVPTPTATPPNFGWPCYEGNGRHAGFQNLNLSLCASLYAAEGTAAAVAAPHYTYSHSGIGSSVSGLAFYDTGNYPASYQGALFFADYARQTVYLMPNGSGVPNASAVTTFANLSGGPVDLARGPGGDIFYVDYDNGRIQRISYLAASAVATASPTFGLLPLTVQFDGSQSTGTSITYAWDLDGDGQFDNSTAVSPSRSYVAAGNYNVRLRVTNSDGTSSTSAPITISAGNMPPVPTIIAPSASLTWKVGDPIAFSGSATDPQDGVLGAAQLTWRLILHHCPSNCHEHIVQDFTGVAAGTFFAIDHDYPCYLELRLIATDSKGLAGVASVALYPQTVALTLTSAPAGLVLGMNLTAGATPLTKTVIVGSGNTVAAASPQTSAGTTYGFVSWTDGGSRVHQIVAPSVPTTYRADYGLPAELSLAQTGGPNPVSAASPLTYVLNVKNTGPVAAYGVVVTDRPPAGSGFVSAGGDGWACGEAGGVVTCTRPTLPIGSAPAITVAVRAPGVHGQVQNEASVSAASPDSNPLDDTSTLSVNVELYKFHTVDPCRIVDTRPLGLPLVAGTDRLFQVTGICGIPASARALSVNVTVTEPLAPGNLRVHPSSVGAPGASTINYGAGQTRASGAVVSLSADGRVGVLCDQAGGTVHFIMDVNGYFE